MCLDEQQLGFIHPGIGDVFTRRIACFLFENTGKICRTQSHDPGELLHRDMPVNIFLNIRQALIDRLVPDTLIHFSGLKQKRQKFVDSQ